MGHCLRKPDSGESQLHLAAAVSAPSPGRGQHVCFPASARGAGWRELRAVHRYLKTIASSQIFLSPETCGLCGSIASATQTSCSRHGIAWGPPCRSSNKKDGQKRGNRWQPGDCARLAGMACGLREGSLSGNDRAPDFPAVGAESTDRSRLALHAPGTGERLGCWLRTHSA